MEVTIRKLVALLGAASVVLGLPCWIPAASAKDDFFDDGLEEFTGLRHQDVHEVAEEELDTMRGRYSEFYFGFDPANPGPSRPGEIVVTGTIPTNGGSLIGQVTVRDTLSSSAFELSTNLLTDSFNNTQGVIQLVQIAGNNNVVYQNLTVDIAIFYGTPTTADQGYTAFRNYLQSRGTRP